jgi:hypothetical protein
MQSFNILKHLIPIKTTGLQRVKVFPLQQETTSQKYKNLIHQFSGYGVVWKQILSKK